MAPERRGAPLASAARPDAPLLAAWLGSPEPQRDLLVRARLHDLLRAGTRHPLTLVSAPAGSGKSDLVAGWTSSGEAPGPVVWVTMDEYEAEIMLWPVIRIGLERAGLDVSTTIFPGAAGTATRPVLRTLAAQIAIREVPIVLVLEEADYLLESQLSDDLAFLIRHSRNKLRLIVITRSDPALPLHRYRLEGSVTEIRAADLNFSESETAALLEARGHLLSSDQIEAVIRRTSGWAAGLTFLAIELGNRADTDAAILEFNGSDWDVAGYLMAEVLDAQTAQMREALLRTSILRWLTPSVMGDLTGHPSGQRLLEAIDRGDCPVSRVPGAGHTYRVQPLFREFLRAQLAYERPELVTELHAIAARSLAASGSLREAIHHAGEAGEWDDASEYLVESLGVGALLNHLDEAWPGSWLELPDRADSPAAWAVRAALELRGGDARSCLDSLAAATKRLDVLDPDLVPGCRLTVSLLEVVCAAGLTADVEAGLAAALIAERRLEPVPLALEVPARELRATVSLCRGRLLLWSGDLPPARVALLEALALVEAEGPDYVLMDVLGNLALTEALLDRPQLAEELVRRGDRLGDKGHAASAERTPRAQAALAWVRLQKGPMSDAQRLLDDAGPGQRDRLVASLFALMSARLLRARGDDVGARAMIHDALSAAAGQLPDWVDKWLRAAQRELDAADAGPGAAADPRHVAHLRRPAPEGRPGLATLLVEPLTPKELEVLGHLADLLSTVEIAAAMHVSVNTVRTHVRHLLRKLGASRRNEAVRIAWELGLLTRTPEPSVARVMQG